MIEVNESLYLKGLIDYFNNIINVHEDFYAIKMNLDFNNENKSKVSVFKKFLIKVKKTFYLMLIKILIVYIYYYYLYWFVLPTFESLEYGFTLNFFDIKVWNSEGYKSEIFNFLIFHFIIIMFIWSIIKTIIYDPGTLPIEYQEVYSSLNIFVTLSNYFENYDINNYDAIMNDNNKTDNNNIALLIQSDKNKFDLTCENQPNKFNIEKILKKYNRMIDIFYELLNVLKKIKNRVDNPNDHIDKLIENEEEESFVNFHSNFASGQTFNYRQFINLSNAIGELKGKIQHFFDKNEFHCQYLTNTSFNECNGKNNRFCKFCFVKKPDRTHHCRKCKTCIRKMDHHCDYLSCCIGINNYKSFILTLFYLTILLIYIFFGTFVHLVKNRRDYVKSIYFFDYISFVILLIIIVIIIFIFLGFHLKLLINNKTTIENFEKNVAVKLDDEKKTKDDLQKDKENQKSNEDIYNNEKKSNPKIETNICENFNNLEIPNKYLFIDKTNKYNLGLGKNLKEVFGTNPLLWLLPISLKNHKKGGYNYDLIKIDKKLNEEIKNAINQLKEKTFSLDLQPDSMEKIAKHDL